MHLADHTDALVHLSGPTCINKHVGYHSAARDVNEHCYIPARPHKTTHFISVQNVGVGKNYNRKRFDWDRNYKKNLATENKNTTARHSGLILRNTHACADTQQGLALHLSAFAPHRSPLSRAFIVSAGSAWRKTGRWSDFGSYHSPRSVKGRACRRSVADFLAA